MEFVSSQEYLQNLLQFVPGTVFFFGNFSLLVLPGTYSKNGVFRTPPTMAITQCIRG